MIPPTKRKQRGGLEERWRRLVRADMLKWCRMALPQHQRPARHHKLLIDALGDVRDGRCDRLMVLMPPGSAKSTYAGINLTSGFASSSALRWAARIISVVELQ